MINSRLQDVKVDHLSGLPDFQIVANSLAFRINNDVTALRV